MKLDIELPSTPPSVGSYMLAKRYKDLVFLSGHGPFQDGALITGKVGADLTAEEGAHAARVTGLNLLATLRAELDDLENVTSVVKLLGMVNVAPGFDNLPAVINGCSDLLIEVFGEKVGRHARSAVGMAELPFGMAVEIEAVEDALEPVFEDLFAAHRHAGLLAGLGERRVLVGRQRRQGRESGAAVLLRRFGRAQRREAERVGEEQAEGGGGLPDVQAGPAEDAQRRLAEAERLRPQHGAPDAQLDQARVLKEIAPRLEHQTAELLPPVALERGRPALPIFHRGVDDGVEQLILVPVVAVERHRADAQTVGQSAHAERLEPVRVRELERRGRDPLA